MNDEANMTDDPKPDPSKPTLPSQIESDEDRLKVVNKILAAEKHRVEVRGFECARLNPGGTWEQVAKGKMEGMVATAKWLNQRHPNSLYMARVLVSAQIPDRPQPAPPASALEMLAEKMGVESEAVDSLPSTPKAPNPDEAPSVPWSVE